VTTAFALLQLFVLLPTSWLVGRSGSARTARHRASYAVGLAGVVALAQLLLRVIDPPAIVQSVEWLSTGDAQSWAPAFSLISCLIGFTAVTLSPISETRPKTYRRILLLIGVALLFLAVRSPIGLAVLWTASAVIAWRELREIKPPSRIAKLFAIYHVPSALAFGLGAVLLTRGHSAAGVTLLLIGIGIREAVIPLHSWFPPFVEYAPMGLVVAFFAPQLGVYAHLELLRGELPHQLAHGVASLGAITAVAGAALGLAQKSARRALAFLVMSQTGLVAFGLDTSSTVAQVGALLTWQVIGVATAGFAMTLASLEARRGELSLRTPAGSFTQTPRMAVAFLFMGFASVGLPLTLGFVAEDLLVQGSVEEFPVLAFALIIATALNGVSVMRAFFMLFSGSAKHIGERDLTTREAAALTVVMTTLLVTGLFPAGTVRGLERVTGEREHQLQGAKPGAASAATAIRSEGADDLACELIQAPVNISTRTGPAGRYRITTYFDLDRATDGREEGRSVEAAWDLGSPIIFEGRRYELDDVHFHTPSTHMLDGMRYPMEMHVVSRAAARSPDGLPQYLIMAVLFRHGNENQEIGGFLDQVSKSGSKGFDRARERHQGFSADGGPRHHYYYYRGSLAAPPYAKVVDVFVSSEPEAASPEQVAKVGAPGLEEDLTPHVLQGLELVE
jgi:carbonic anhydrase